jgi:predicted membrane channel-forming protein YqfA (hemolysin III family)
LALVKDLSTIYKVLRLDKNLTKAGRPTAVGHIFAPTTKRQYHTGMTVQTASPPPVTPKTARPWPVTALALFLLLQTAGLLGLAAFKIIAIDSASDDLIANWNDSLGILYLLLACLSLLAALGFFRLWQNSWLMAMLLQGLCLLNGLIIYFQNGPAYSYAIMTYAIFMVIYLNHYEVRGAFHARKLLMADPKEWLE